MLHGVCLKVKPVGKPDAVAPHVRFDERGWETGLWQPRPSSTLLSTFRNDNLNAYRLIGGLITKWPNIIGYFS